MNDSVKLEAIRAWLAEWRKNDELYPPENRKQKAERDGEIRIVGEIEDILAS